MATNNKYDRQLRLWGAKGQAALGETTVVLLRASTAGTETLKNLVLPGIGSILVVDDQTSVGQQDAASNFFTTVSSKPRAEVALELLQELNPDVEGSCKTVSSLADMNLTTDVLASISTRKLVVAADLEPGLLHRFALECEQASVPLVVVQAYGLIGYVRLQTPPLPLIQPKPDNEKPDLRLVTSFSSFVEFANSIDLKSLTDAEHGHVPYPVLLYKAAEAWKASHDGKLPSSFAEKQEFRQIVQKSARKPDLEVNFEEAANNAYLAYTETEVDGDQLKQLRETCANGTLPKLHSMVTALLAFVERHNGQSPLQGNIPDMTASTAMYVQLQKLYHDKGSKDLAELKSLLPSPVPDDELEVFCKNVAHLDLYQPRSIRQEYTEEALPDEVHEDLMMVTYDPYEVPEHTPLLWYMALRACNMFHQEHGRYPGTPPDSGSYQEDVPLLQTCIDQVITKLRMGDADLVNTTLGSAEQKYAKEMTRYANAELHNVASVIGGVASQEAVKLVTGQYVPFNHTYIYNGIASTGGVYNV